MWKRAGTSGRGQNGIGLQQSPGSERRGRYRLAEDQRSRRNLRKLFLNQRRAPVELEAVQHPIPLHGAKLPRRVCYRDDFDPQRFVPDVLRPGRGARWTGGQDQPSMHRGDRVQFLG